MGIVRCKVHGEVGVNPWIDEKIVNNIRFDYQGLPPEKEKKIFVVTLQCVFDESEEMEVFNINHYISEENIYKYKLKHLYRISTEEEEAKFDKKIPQLGVTCGKCFEDYIEKYNIEVVREWEIK